MNAQRNPRHPSSQRFADVLDEALAVHDKKQQDYGREDDPFANVRASEDFGIPDWVGCAIRMNDKIRRIQRAAQRWGEGVSEGDLLANESLEDAFMDLLVYAGIGVVMLREAERADEVRDITFGPVSGGTVTHFRLYTNDGETLAEGPVPAYDPWEGVPPLPLRDFIRTGLSHDHLPEEGA